MKDEKMYTRWVPMYLNYDEAKLHKKSLTKKEWNGFMKWFWGFNIHKNDKYTEPIGWILQTESDHPKYFDNIELFEEMFEQYKEELKYELEEK